MNLIVFGATGMVGKQLVQQGLFKGHHVSAFGRNVYTTDFLQTENLQLVQGALFDEGEVFKAIKGCDAVLSSLGGGSDGSDKTRTLGMKNIIAQMKKAGIKRIIAIGNRGVLQASEEKMIIDTEDYPPEFIAVGREHVKAYELLKDSGLDWTFVCPPDIINAGPTGEYTTRAEYPVDSDNERVNAGDLAMFMLNELEKNEFVQKRVGISN